MNYFVFTGLFGKYFIFLQDKIINNSYYKQYENDEEMAVSCSYGQPLC